MSFKKTGAPACLAALLLVAGCGYGEVSPVCYEYAKALFAISNRQASDRLDGVETQIRSAAEAGELSPTEAAWLGAVVDDCRAGRWDDAHKASRQIMEDQVRR